MRSRLALPSIVGLNIEGLPYGVVTYLQGVHDALNVLDRNVLYKDAVDTVVQPPRITAISAQGQAFSVSGTSVASGDDFATLVRDVKVMLEDLLRLRQAVEDMANKLQEGN